MIVLDAKILLYAYDETSAHHKKAWKWLEKTLSGADAVGLPWQSIGAFLRIVTNSKLPGLQDFAPFRELRFVNTWD